MTFALIALLLLVFGGGTILLLATRFDTTPLVPAAIGLGASLLALMFFALSYSAEGALLGMYRLDGLSATGGMTLSLVAALTILGVMADPNRYYAGRSEVYALILYVALGATLMIGANNLLLLYVGIEMASYSSYILVGYYRDDRYSTEAAGKYFVLGAVASAFLLYGFSLIFGAGGGFYYDQIAATMAASEVIPVVLWPGLALVLVGFGFKLALVPFHGWTPDAYQGAPTMFAALVSVGPKVGAVVALGVLLTRALGADDIAVVWQQALVWLAILTMTVGNLQALNQTNIKRLLGYSSVAQLGTIAVGVAAGSVQGLGAVAFYGLAYAITNVGAFTVVAALSQAGLGEEVEDYKGLGKRHWPSALLFTLFLLSLAGVPLLAGFAGKLFVFKSAVDAGLLTLAVVAVLNTVLAYFYYVRVVVQMWLVDAEEDTASVHVHPVALTALAVGAVGVVLVGTFPGVALEVVRGGLEPLVPFLASR
ncbi:MAG: NADH-quinone oxidoreductase subunit N [Trueperaceae bacterium]|nr:NADH-quinone oxidoreductase subunit N [Trueperaceae bacterium]